MSSFVRGALFFAGVVAIIVGLVLIISGPGTVAPGLYAFVVGAVLILVPLIERNRYRSAAAEQAGLPPGPGGGEAPGASLEPRFQSTDEQFVDPTTGVTMQVLVDPGTGERRYVARA